MGYVECSRVETFTACPGRSYRRHPVLAGCVRVVGRCQPLSVLHRYRSVDATLRLGRRAVAAAIASAAASAAATH